VEEMKMAFSWRILGMELWKRRDGLLLGAAVGLVAAYFAIRTGDNVQTVAEAGKSLADMVFQRQSSVELAKYKIYGTFMIISAAVGVLIQWMLERVHLIRERKR
jgi:hypothetical protein